MRKKIKGSDTQKIVPEELVQKREDEGSHVAISAKRNQHN